MSTATPTRARAAIIADLRDPVLVLGGYGYRNVGDEAILSGLLRQLGDDRRVSVISRTPAETAALHSVRSVPIRNAVAELRRHASLIIGGGGLFGRDMGTVGRLLPMYGLLASSLRLQIAIHGIGVDHDTRAVARTLLRALATRAVAFTVRDRRSRTILKEWGMDAAVVPDLSASLPASSPATGVSILRLAGVDVERPVVALALTGMRVREADRLKNAIARCIESWPTVQFCFVPMSHHPFVGAHNDLLFARELKARIATLLVVESIHRPEDIMAVFGQVTAAVCMRYHSLLFAHRAGTPIVPLPYAPKCDAWVEEHGLTPVRNDGEALAMAVGSIIASRRENASGARA